MFKKFALLATLFLLLAVIGCTSFGTPALPTDTGAPVAPAATAVPAQPTAAVADAATVTIAATPTNVATATMPTPTLLTAADLALLATPTLSTGAPTAAVPAGQSNCIYRAAFIADVTVPDGTAMAPGATFTKTWRLRNDGTCAWGYKGSALHRLVFVGGNQLGAPGAIELPFPELGPGGTVDLSVTMIAPRVPGTFTSNWRLQVDNGPQVGVGPNGDTPLYVQIVVPGAPTPAPVPAWKSFSSAAYPYTIAYPAEMNVAVENVGTIGDAVQVERVTFRLPNDGRPNRSSAITIEAAQHAYSRPLQCQRSDDVLPGIQGCRRSLPQPQGTSQELVWFRVPLSGQEYLYFSVQLIYDDAKYVTALAYMLQTFKYVGPPITVTPPPCTYRAAFVADVTVPDYTVIAPNTKFVKTWRVRNEGTCSWGYAGFALHRLVFVGGDQLGAPKSIELPFPELGPGGTADISVPMVSPMNPATYTSNWRLQVDNGPQVGFGPNGDRPFYARIVVPGPIPPPTPSVPPPVVWNTWGGSKHHYEVDFPATWSINVQSFQPQGPGRDPEAVYLRPPYAQWAMVQIHALKGAPPIKGYENCVKNMTFHGVPACSIVRENDQVPHRILVFQKGESYYHIEGWYNSPQQLGVFDDIVKSFRFTP